MKLKILVTEDDGEPIAEKEFTAEQLGRLVVHAVLGLDSNGIIAKVENADGEEAEKEIPF